MDIPFAVITKSMSSSEEVDRDGRIKPTEINRVVGESTAPRLIAFWDGGSLTRTLPAEGTLTIGRSSTCDVRIDHPSVSRKHAILHVGAVNKIEDASSANGTRIAGRDIASGAPALVVPGEVVEVDYRFQKGADRMLVCRAAQPPVCLCGASAVVVNLSETGPG